MKPEYVVLTTLVVYKVVLVTIGVVCQRRTRDGDDFFLGGRKLGPVVAAISASASSSSAWTLLGVSGFAYHWGVSAVWIFVGCVGGFVFNWYVLAPALRRSPRARGALTLSEVLAGPPDAPLRRAVLGFAAVIILFSFTFYVAAQFEGSGKALAGAFGLSFSWSVLIGAGIVILYMFLGGFWAVSVTDTVQGLVMAAACIVLPITALIEVGGPSGLIEGLGTLPSDYRSLLGGGAAGAGFGFVLGLLGIGLGYPGQPHVVNRFMALREGELELRRGRRIAVTWAVVVYSGMLVLGWSGRLLFDALEDREALFVTATSTLLHPVVAGVMLAAVLSAIMSTADSQLLVAASAVTSDLRIGERSGLGLLARSRLVVVILGALAVVVALGGSKAIFSRVLFAWTALGAAFGPLLLAVVLGREVGPRRALAAMALGFALAVTFYSIEATAGGFVERVVPFLAAGAVLLAPCRRRRPVL